jgi:DNA modification methylase
MTDVRLGDCRVVMAEMQPASVDACVCDPPYGLEFMGKEWDRLDAGFRKPGIGERATNWPQFGGDRYEGNNPT